VILYFVASTNGSLHSYKLIVKLISFGLANLVTDRSCASIPTFHTCIFYANRRQASSHIKEHNIIIIC
jgi:hypothetical protein